MGEKKREREREKQEEGGKLEMEREGESECRRSPLDSFLFLSPDADASLPGKSETLAATFGRQTDRQSQGDDERRQDACLSSVFLAKSTRTPT